MKNTLVSSPNAVSARITGYTLPDPGPNLALENTPAVGGRWFDDHPSSIPLYNGVEGPTSGGVGVSTAKARLLDTIRSVGGSDLRDLHLFDESAHEALYLRDDVADVLSDVDLPKYIDNERYGFVTRETYDDLHYAEYQYTVRGFDDFEQFRTFIGPAHEIGILASFDQGKDHDYAEIAKVIGDVVAAEGLTAFAPETGD